MKINISNDLAFKVLNKVGEVEANSYKYCESITPELINSCKIDPNEHLPPPPVAMYIKNTNGEKITLFTKGNFSIVTGKAKSRKTFLASMFMAGAIANEFSDKFFDNSNGMNLLFDTEQAKYKVQQITKRIANLSGIANPTNFEVYSLRGLDPLQRLHFIEDVLNTTQNINYVVIDGIIDLDLDPILNAEQASSIIQKLLVWTATFNIHITCVLHYNKTASTLLGHLGSFAHRKADCIIEVEKDTETDNISFVKVVDCREKEFEPFAISIDKYGIPSIDTEYVFNEKTARVKTVKPPPPPIPAPHDFDKSIHDLILQNVFKSKKEYSYSDLWPLIQCHVNDYCKDKNYKKLADNPAKQYITYYTAKDFIATFGKGKSTRYCIAGQKTIDENLAV